MRFFSSLCIVTSWGFLAILLAGCQGFDPQVGQVTGTSYRLPNGQIVTPYGERIGGLARPVDLVLSPDGKWIAVKDIQNLKVFSATDLKEVGSAPLPNGSSLHGLIFTPDGKELLVTNSRREIISYQISSEGKPTQSKVLALETQGNTFPLGMAWWRGKLVVCQSVKNNLAIINWEAQKVERTIPTGVAPFGVAIIGDKAYVSNQGGRIVPESQTTAPSAGTPVKVKPNGIVDEATVSILNLAKGQELSQIPVGLQPTKLLFLARRNELVVANANSDSLSFISVESDSVARTVKVAPREDLPFGSQPVGLALSPGGDRLFVTLTGNNALATVRLDTVPKVEGYVPTDGYPSAVIWNSGRLVVVNNKGIGSRAQRNEKGRQSYDYAGTLTAFAPPSGSTAQALTSQVLANCKSDQLLESMQLKRRANRAPVPVPERVGEPSVFKHVIYVIKENRTYDQLFGAIARGDGEPKLVEFTEKEAPNHHKLALDYVLLDNYYCNGVLSADGHSWATEGNVTPYLNNAFGGFNRSYTFGDDPITYSSTGFIWDGVLDAGLTFRNYGEMDYAQPTPAKSAREIWDLYAAGKPQTFSQNIGIARLRAHSCREYPGWNMNIPDVLRMDAFLKEFREFEKNGRFPNLTIVYLPQDHFGGGVTPRSHMADNDLAVGRLVEAVSKSQYWRNTVIFINEDDPQNGFDHVDGHRSFCFVVSAYSKRKTTVSNFYNQTSVLHTIARILGLQPMNQLDAASPLMTACFQNRPDFSPYECQPNQFPLDEWRTSTENASPLQKEIEAKLAKIDLRQREVQTYDEMESLSRYAWHMMRGWETPFPIEFVGARPQERAKRGLVLSGEDD
ncbi:MAG: hypothetical protein MUC92_03965 [Fimbriimonadaceae bacterium]|jgi:DNA-binding beta-propeller fold protein YncE|nr:hypothetical protein [Fimbriimonadaceae bacterium]